MSFTLPTFNITVNIWRKGNPLTNPPDVVTPANLCRGERNSSPWGLGQTPTTDQGSMWLLCPKWTDIRDAKFLAGVDTVEAPAGSGRIYTVVWVDDAGLGFSNEHRFAEIVAKGPWGVPFPGPPVPPPPFCQTPTAPVIIGQHADPGINFISLGLANTALGEIMAYVLVADPFAGFPTFGMASGSPILQLEQATLPVDPSGRQVILTSLNLTTTIPGDSLFVTPAALSPVIVIVVQFMGGIPFSFSAVQTDGSGNFTMPGAATTCPVCLVTGAVAGYSIVGDVAWASPASVIQTPDLSTTTTFPLKYQLSVASYFQTPAGGTQMTASYTPGVPCQVLGVIDPQD
jgi:hypothetical protein